LNLFKVYIHGFVQNLVLFFFVNQNVSFQTDLIGFSTHSFGRNTVALKRGQRPKLSNRTD
jgi:hypothetical protein